MLNFNKIVVTVSIFSGRKLHDYRKAVKYNNKSYSKFRSCPSLIKQYSIFKQQIQ